MTPLNYYLFELNILFEFLDQVLNDLLILNFLYSNIIDDLLYSLVFKLVEILFNILLLTDQFSNYFNLSILLFIY